jgi:hypothetical protein
MTVSGAPIMRFVTVRPYQRQNQSDGGWRDGVIVERLLDAATGTASIE